MSKKTTIVKLLLILSMLVLIALMVYYLYVDAQSKPVKVSLREQYRQELMQSEADK